MDDLHYRPTGEPPLMAGAPPFPAGSLVTLANWQEPPFNRWAFQHVRELIPTARIAHGTRSARRWPAAEQSLDGITFPFIGRELTVAEMLAASFTDGFAVLHGGRLVAEQYFNGLTPDTPHLLMSVSKSVVSTVAGALADRGLLDVEARVSAIVPELGGTSFAGASVRDLLDMRAGTRFNEDYADPASDVRAYEQVYLWRPAAEARDGTDPADAIEYFGTLSNDGPHGGPFRYRSILTDVLGWVLERAGGVRLADLITTHVWQPMGAEYDADITVDAHGNALADGGMSATLRDLVRFGELFLRGASDDRTIVPDRWVADTIRGAPDGPQAFVDGGGYPGYPAGAHYRNCWWVRDPAAPFFYANGIHGQHVFVHGPSQTVIAKLSTWPTASRPDLFNLTLAAALSITATLGRED